ncbi:MAG: glycosyltransferase [Chloroflexaceae bacterium]|jgi:UDP-N-acetylglucosamine:LPS N-acetylglucosamine transferase|nr:glycosyltransferase [Chloroflexaceae bacterium]
MEAPVHVVFALSDTGGGHRSAAVAIAAALQETSSETSSSMLDVLIATNVPFLRESPRLYDSLSTRWLRLYDSAFQLTDGTMRVNLLSQLAYLLGRGKLNQAIRQANPQIVVVTHPLVGRLMVAVRKATGLAFPIVTVVTDLVSLHAAWTCPGVDLALVPTEESYTLMERRGMPAERMVQTGFPVHPKFVRYACSQAESRRELGLHVGQTTVLVTGGGVGSGNLGELVLHLEQQLPACQVLVVTGKNKKLYQELQSAVRSPLIKLYGFVDNMEVLMAASDIVVTKAGPGTLMEALVMRRPAIVTEAVGMQERGNIDFVLGRGLGAFCPSPQQIVAAINELSQPERYAATVARLENAVPRDGSFQIANHVLEQVASMLRTA